MKGSRILVLSVVISSACSPALPPVTPRVTLDAAALPSFERIASEEVDRIVSDWGATRAVIVLLDPKTGEVLISAGRELGRSVPALASEHSWITGSTLKTLTVASALEDHRVTLDQRFGCGRRSYGTEALSDADESPCTSLDLAGILAKSSNVGAAYVFDTLGSARLSAHLSQMHIGDPPGSLPTLEDDHSLRAANFGGGEVAKATPLQMARAYGALFNGGVYVLPSLHGGAASSARVFSEETASLVVPMLESAVRDGGTGRAASIAGARVAGKTGTAEWTDESGQVTTYASFIGAVLDHDPPWVVLVGLEAPSGKANGPKAAAPAWSRFVTRALAARSK
jgi:cell division protein FtsI (penicillin-binding protein 3)